MNTPRDPLSKLLGEWPVNPSRDPEFRTQVWAKIEGGRTTGDGANSWAGFARGHAAMVAGALAFAIVVGAVGGRSQARARVAEDSARIASAYVQSLDARSMPMR